MDMRSRELFIPQLVDKVGANVLRIDVEVARVVRFDTPSEEWEMFEDVSEGRDEVEDGLLHRVVRLGDRWKEVVDRGPDERNDKVQGVDLYGVWARERETCGGSDSDGSDGWLRHGVVEGGG
jgi:hypothetical protein